MVVVRQELERVFDLQRHHHIVEKGMWSLNRVVMGDDNPDRVTLREETIKDYPMC